MSDDIVQACRLCVAFTVRCLCRLISAPEDEPEGASVYSRTFQDFSSLFSCSRTSQHWFPVWTGIKNLRNYKTHLQINPHQVSYDCDVIGVSPPAATAALVRHRRSPWRRNPWARLAERQRDTDRRRPGRDGWTSAQTDGWRHTQVSHSDSLSLI